MEMAPFSARAPVPCVVAAKVGVKDAWGFIADKSGTG
jgi:hypothetical protein